MADTNNPGNNPAWISSAASACVPSLLFFLCALILICGAFTATGALFLLGCYQDTPELNTPGMQQGLLIRLAAFSLLGLLAFFALLKLRPLITPGPPPLPVPLHSHPRARKDLLLLIPVLAFGSALATPFLNDYPWTAPDEVHHMNVAKNIALHGLYASGNPSAGFIRFDPYDSVGAPVLLPVAAAFKLGGILPQNARLIIAGYFLALLTTLFFFLKPVLGKYTACAAALLLPMAFSSIYLSRTLYGEVPAFFYLLAGLLLWRKSIVLPQSFRYAFLAGACFGLAILCKTILLLSAFAFLGAFIIDRLTHKRLQFKSLLITAFGTLFVIALWWTFMSLGKGDAGNNAQNTVALYHHYLLFGLQPCWKNLSTTLFTYPLTHLLLFFATLFMIPNLLKKIYDPALIVLLLCAGFFFYWWVFFTPGQLPRYLWMSYAIGSIATAHLLTRLAAYLKRTSPAPKRALALAACIILLTPCLHWTAGQLHQVYTNREMRPILDLCQFLSKTPSDTPIATTYLPLLGIADLFADKHLEILAGDALNAYDSIITLDNKPPQQGILMKTFGPFQLWSTATPTGIRYE